MIVITTHRKDQKWPAGHGYGRNIGTAKNPVWVAERGRPVSKWVIHATHGNIGTLSVNEAKFLRDSPDVSCQDVIGKSGEVYEILPDDHAAWHAGVCLPGWGIESIGTEIHHAIGESYTSYQFETLTALGRQKIARHGLTEADIDTHRAIALPKGRKSDPHGWSDADFYAWRASLFTPPPAPPEPDWEMLWGSDFPYRPTHGFPSTWRALHRAGTSIGKPLSDEHTFLGKQVQLFEFAILTWTPADNVRVFRGEF